MCEVNEANVEETRRSYLECISLLANILYGHVGEGFPPFNYFNVGRALNEIHQTFLQRQHAQDEDENELNDNGAQGADANNENVVNNDDAQPNAENHENLFSPE